MSRDKQIDEMYEDIVEIFDEEYGKRNLITPQNTAEKLTAKGYSKASEIFEEIEKMKLQKDFISRSQDFEFGYAVALADISELKKKYTEGK